MLRLVKYLKPFALLILITIALLFIQAMADLSLPDYMGQIVNKGIQAGGIENSVPQAIRQSEMKRLMLFLSEDEQALVSGSYTLVDKDSPDYAQYVKTYPALANAPVYVLKQIDSAAIDKLNPILGRALTAVYGIEQMIADPSKAAMVQRTGLDLSMFAKGGDVFALLGLLPASTRAQMLNGMNKTFDAMGESMVIQSATGAIKAEYVALGLDTGALQSSYMVRIGILMLLITLVSVVCTILVGYLSARTAAGMGRDVRRDLFKRVENFSSTEFDRFSTASLITRSTNDITQIQMVVIMVMRMVIYAPIMGVGGITRAMSKDVSMWWIIALAVVILLGLIITVFSVSLPKFKIMQSLIDRLNLVTRENLSGMMVIRAFNMQKFEEKRFDKANRDLTDTGLFVSRVMVIMMPMMMLIMNGLSLLIIWVGAHQVAESNMQVGDMMAFLQYAMQIVMSFLMMSIMFIILPRASVSAGRIADVLETEPVINDPTAPKAFQQPFQGTIEFRNVSFRYPGAEDDVLHDLSFAVQPGQTTAFIGSTGSGKSTLVNLIPRFYDVSNGAILVDGTDIREVAQHELREKIGYVPQKSMLFSGSIESNLRYADQDASEDTLKAAADIAQATEFITATPEGMAAETAQGGTNVSGGQKQRLSIARALVKRPPIYIFDDSFSALDFKTDAALRRALKQHTGSSTLLIVTQRVSTIKNAEQIIVLDEGRIVGKGTHRELMDACETYREIALSQLSQEELA
jgi:ATP-binding cassette subfamily B protein